MAKIDELLVLIDRLPESAAHLPWTVQPKSLYGYRITNGDATLVIEVDYSADDSIVQLIVQAVNALPEIAAELLARNYQQLLARADSSSIESLLKVGDEIIIGLLGDHGDEYIEQHLRLLTIDEHSVTYAQPDFAWREITYWFEDLANHKEVTGIRSTTFSELWRAGKVRRA